MIYLLKSFGPGEKKLLKIGYCEDCNWEQRLGKYRTHNPCIEVISIVSGLDRYYESKLHDFLKDFRYPNFGREWYEYYLEMENFFVDFDKKIINSEYEYFNEFLDEEMWNSRWKIRVEKTVSNRGNLKQHYWGKLDSVIKVYSILKELKEGGMYSDVIDNYIKKLKKEIISKK